MGEMTNPFPKKGDVEILEEADYEGFLEEVFIKDFQDFNDKDSFNKGLVFVFKLPKAKATIRKQIFKCSMHEKSNCYGFVKQLMSAKEFRAAMKDNETFWAAIQALQGRFFTISVCPSSDGLWNNIEDIRPMSKEPIEKGQLFEKMEDAPAPDIASIASPIDYDDSEIPF